MFQRVSFLYLSSAILSHLLALGHVLLLRQRGPLDLFLAGLTVPTHALGCVQFPVAKQVCCGDPRLVLQNTSPHSDRPFSAGQANVFLRITAARHPHSTCAHAPCCQSFGGLYKAIQSSVYIIKSARACGEAIYHIIRRRRLGAQRLGFANSFKLFQRPVAALYSAAHGA